MVVLAAVDGRKESDPVVTTGQRLATTHETELVVPHVLSPGEVETDPQATQQQSSTHSATERAESRAKEIVEATLDAPDWDRIRPEGHLGSPSDTMLEVADDLDAEYIVVGGRDRSPVGRAIFGSVSQAVVLHSQRPVVVMTD